MPKLCAKALAHVGKRWVGSPHHGSIGLWPIPTTSLPNMARYICFQVCRPNTGTADLRYR